MQTIKTRTIMTKADHGDKWFGIDYHMNLYKGCNFGCIYCNVRSDTYHTDDFEEIKIKENALEILERELASKAKPGVVSFGTLSDPYNEKEVDLKLTRGALELILKYGFGVSIDTKSDLILRDLDLLQRISEQQNVIIKISVTTMDERLASILEPKVISPKQRLRLLRKLREADLFSGLLLHPVLPFITDNEDNITKIIQEGFKANTNFIYTKMGMTLQTNQKDYYFEKIEEHYKGLSLDYKAVYGNRFHCNTVQYRHLMENFLAKTHTLGILSDMDEIIRSYKKEIPQTTQISLF